MYFSVIFSFIIFLGATKEPPIVFAFPVFFSGDIQPLMAAPKISIGFFMFPSAQIHGDLSARHAFLNGR